MKKLLFLMIFVVLGSCNFAYAQTEPEPAPTPTVQSNVDGTVCLSQEEAKAIYALAAKGAGFDKYATKAEADIRERDEIINALKIKYATAVQDTINLSNQATRDNAALEQYRQFFFTKGRVKCIGACLQFGNGK